MRAPGGKLRMEVFKCHVSCSTFDIEKPEPDDNFKTYKINDRLSRFVVSLNFDNK